VLSLTLRSAKCDRVTAAASAAGSSLTGSAQDARVCCVANAGRPIVNDAYVAASLATALVSTVQLFLVKWWGRRHHGLHLAEHVLSNMFSSNILSHADSRWGRFSKKQQHMVAR